MCQKEAASRSPLFYAITALSDRFGVFHFFTIFARFYKKM